MYLQKETNLFNKVRRLGVGLNTAAKQTQRDTKYYHLPPPPHQLNFMFSEFTFFYVTILIRNTFLSKSFQVCLCTFIYNKNIYLIIFSYAQTGTSHKNPRSSMPQFDQMIIVVWRVVGLLSCDGIISVINCTCLR